MAEDPGNTVDVATRVMYELLGRRWVWPPIQAVEEYETDQRNIHLRGRPIRSVNSVTVDGMEVVDFDIFNTSTIRLPKKCGNVWLWTSGVSWSGPGPVPLNWTDSNAVRCLRTVIVDYVYGAEAPEGIENAINILAEEIQKAFDHDDECRLPQRVTEVSSRGITMETLNPNFFIESGLTGIPEVDLFVKIHNPSNAKARARVYSADFRPGRRHARSGS